MASAARSLTHSNVFHGIALGILAILVGFAVGAAVTLIGPLYIAAGIVGLAAGAALIASAQVGLIAFEGAATLLPFGVVPIPLGTFKLTFVDVTLSLLLLMWVGRLFIRRDERPRGSDLAAPLLVFVGLSIAAFLGGTGTTAETTRLFLKLINSILFFFTIVNLVRARRQVEQIYAALILGGAASAAIGIILYVLPTDLASRLLNALGPLGYPTGGVLRYIASTDTLRAISTSVDPNIFGAMLMIVAVVNTSQLLAKHPVLPKLLLSACLATIGAALLLSYSRGSWMGYVAALMLIATLKYRRVWILFGLGAVILALGVAPSLGGFFAHLESGFEARDQAAAMRLGEYKDAFTLISQYPLLGVGFGVAPDVNLYIGVSSIYLLLAEQTGLIGLTSYLVTVALLVWRGLSTAIRAAGEDGQILLLGSATALVAALTAGAFDHHFVNLQFPHLVALFWMMAGLTMVQVELIRKS